MDILKSLPIFSYGSVGQQQASISSHFDYNLHFIDCLFIFVVSLGRTILFVMALGLAVREGDYKNKVIFICALAVVEISEICGFYKALCDIEILSKEYIQLDIYVLLSFRNINIRLLFDM